MVTVMQDPLDQPLIDLVGHLTTAFGDDLQSLILFGSAAEGRQRAVSDTNMVMVVRRFTPERVAAAREHLALARIALRLRLMVLCSDEIPSAVSAFAVKFADILRRRRVLFGSDPFIDVVIPRPAAIAQLRQAVLNVVLRLREQSLVLANDASSTLAAAEAAGGLRACAAQLLTLEGVPAATPRAALEQIAGGTMDDLSAAREGRLPVGGGNVLIDRLLACAVTMRVRAEQLA